MVSKAPSQPSSDSEHNLPLPAKQARVLLGIGAVTVELASKNHILVQDRRLYPVLYKISTQQGGEEQ